MSRTAVAAVAVGAVVVAALAFAPIGRAQGPGRPGPDPTLLRGPGSAIGAGIRELRTEELSVAKIESGGVAVESVRENSPASRAGLRIGDVVVEFDGERVRGVRSFSRLVSETPPGRTVAAVVVRGGNRQTLQITPEAGRVSIDVPDLRILSPEVRDRIERQLRNLPRDVDLDLPRGGLTVRPGVRLGMSVSPLSDQLAAYFGVREGVLVATVQDGSAAARAGIRAGDVITAVNGRNVRSVADVAAALRDAEAGTAVEMRVMRDRQEMTLKVELGIRN